MRDEDNDHGCDNDNDDDWDCNGNYGGKKLRIIVTMKPLSLKKWKEAE